MNAYHIGFIGLLAGFCTTVSFIPQFVKILQTRQVRDISLIMYTVLTGGIFLWLVYGILIRELPIILANAVSLMLCSAIIVLKVVYGRGRG